MGGAVGVAGSVMATMLEANRMDSQALGFGVGRMRNQMMNSGQNDKRDDD
jgi:hypothetical protein